MSSSSEESRDFNVHLNVLFAGINSYFVPLVGAPYFHNSVEIFFPEGRFFYDRGGSSVSLQRAIPDQRFAGYIQLDSPIPLNSDFDRLQWNVCDALASFLAGMNTTLCSGKSSMIIQKARHLFEINVLFFTFFAWGTQANYQRFQALQFPGDEEVSTAQSVVSSGNLSQYLGRWSDDFFGGPYVRL